MWLQKPFILINTTLAPPVGGAVHGPEAVMKYNKSNWFIHSFIYREYNPFILKHASRGRMTQIDNLNMYKVYSKRFYVTEVTGPQLACFKYY